MNPHKNSQQARPLLTIIFHVYNNQKVLDLQTEKWLEWSDIAKLEVIFIDDGSKPPLDLSKIPSWVRKARIIDDIAWNQPGAKNLAAHLASGSWLLFLDADQFFFKNEILDILTQLNTLDQHTLYRFKRFSANTGKEIESHQNCQLIHKPDYEDFGGYDEDFAGNYGHEDAYFERLWRLQGRKIALLQTPRIMDRSELGTTGLVRNARINELLRRRKIRHLHCLQNPIGRALLSLTPLFKLLLKMQVLADGMPREKIRFQWKEL
jgi:glycosyltransferase involved in cell wall biosynthesis